MIAQASLATQPSLTPEEYLVLEDQSDVKHEYIDGQIYAMAGTTDQHNTTASIQSAFYAITFEAAAVAPT